MSLKSFMSQMSQHERELFAARCQTTKGHLQNIMYGMKPCHPTLAARIEVESKGVVTRKSLCPEIFSATWPELAQRKPKVAA